MLLIFATLCCPAHTALAAGDGVKGPDISTIGAAPSPTPGPYRGLITTPPAVAVQPQALPVRDAAGARRDFGTSVPAGPITAAQRAKLAELPAPAFVIPDGQKLADVSTVIAGPAPEAEAVARADAAKRAAMPRPWSPFMDPALGAIPRPEWTGAVAAKPVPVLDAAPATRLPAAVAPSPQPREPKVATTGTARRTPSRANARRDVTTSRSGDPGTSVEGRKAVKP